MAYNFGTVDDHGNRMVLDNILDAPTACTIALWYYMDLTPGGTNNTHIVSRRDAGVTDGWAFWAASDRKPGFVTIGGTTVEISYSSATVTLDTWTHLMATWDGSDVIFYHDGVSNTTGHTQACGATTKTVELGPWHGHSGAKGIASRLSDLFIWDIVLTPAECASVYRGGIPRWGDLQGWWPGEGDPGYNLMTGVASSVGAGTITYIDSMAVGNPRPGKPQPETLGGNQPHIHRQDVNLVPDIPDPNLEETLITDGTSSETVVIPEPNGITTVWTKGYSSITTVWAKGPNSYA